VEAEKGVDAVQHETVLPGRKKLHVDSLLRSKDPAGGVQHDRISHAPSEDDDQIHHFTAGPDAAHAGGKAGSTGEKKKTMAHLTEKSIIESGSYPFRGI